MKDRYHVYSEKERKLVEVIGSSTSRIATFMSSQYPIYHNALLMLKD